MTELGERVRQFGLGVEEIPAGEMPETGRRLCFLCPTGHALEFFAEKRQIGNGLGTLNPEVKPETVKGMKPTRFDHCLLYGDDIDANLKLGRQHNARLQGLWPAMQHYSHTLIIIGLDLANSNDIPASSSQGYLLLPDSAASNGVRNVKQVSKAFDETLRLPP